MSVDHEPALSGVKTCTHCRETKPVIAFAVCKRAADGLASHCRDCNGAYAAEIKVRKRMGRKQRIKYGFRRTIIDEA